MVLTRAGRRHRGGATGHRSRVRVLLDRGDPVWVEDPGYPMTWGALAAAGVRVCPIPVDTHGLDVGAGIRSAPGARVAFVTPSNRFPLGVVLAMARRLELLAWARETGAWIVEDDFDSEFDAPDQGMHLVAYLRDDRSDVAVERAARRAGIAVRATSRWYRKAPPRAGLMLGFTGFSREAIVPAAARLAEVLAR